MDPSWKLIDTDHKSLDEVYGELSAAVEEAIGGHKGEPVGTLWPMDKEWADNNKE